MKGRRYLKKSYTKVIALVFSDLHLNIWSRFNNQNKRTLEQFRVLHTIRDKARQYDVPVLFCGDFFHKSNNIDTDLIDLIFQNRYSFPKRVIGITGNHDTNCVTTIGSDNFDLYKFISYTIPEVECINFKFTEIIPYTRIYGVPYIDHNIGLNKYLKSLKLDHKYKNVLLLHTDYPGACDTDGRVVNSVENLSINTLNKFDLVLCGHIHKPQRLSKKVYMVGAPNQQRRTDQKCDMGYWELYSDMSMVFKPLDDFPKFIDVESEDEVVDDGNYYTVLPKITSKQLKSKHKITKRLSKKRLARRYMRKKGISDKTKQELLVDILIESESC